MLEQGLCHSKKLITIETADNERWRSVNQCGLGISGKVHAGCKVLWRTGLVTCRTWPSCLMVTFGAVTLTTCMRETWWSNPLSMEMTCLSLQTQLHTAEIAFPQCPPCPRQAPTPTAGAVALSYYIFTDP